MSELQSSPEVTSTAPRFSMTASAASRIQELVQQQGLPATGGLRVGVKGGGCSGLMYVFEFVAGATAEDHVVEHGDARVFVDPRSMKILKGTSLDFVRDLIWSGFRVTNPAVKQTCGCGESFSL